jgi:hypothetical protein
VRVAVEIEPVLVAQSGDVHLATDAEFDSLDGHEACLCCPCGARIWAEGWMPCWDGAVILALSQASRRRCCEVAREFVRSGSVAERHDISSRAFSDAWRRTGSFVYVVQADTGHVKIGRSTMPEVRIASLRTCCPVEVRVVGVVRADYDMEPRLHRACAASRVRGEWFDPTREVASALWDHLGLLLPGWGLRS